MRRMGLRITGTIMLLAIGGAVAMRAAGAEETAQSQELLNVTASSQIAVARWTKCADSYVLQLVLDRRRASTTLCGQVANADLVTSISQDEMRQLGIVDVAEALTTLVPQNIGMPMPTLNNSTQGSSQDPCSRLPMTIDGQPTTSALNQPWPPLRKESRVQVWLLKADGTLILPGAYSCEKGFGGSEIVYRFPVEESTQAVAVAIRIGNDFHIGKIRRE